MWNKLKDFLAREWAMVSTKIGVVLTAISATAPVYAHLDKRIAILGFVVGVIAIVWREETDA